MEKNQRRSMMKMREEKAKEWSEKQKKIEREVASKKPSVPKVPTPAASAPNPMSMDISHDWFKKRQDGEQGLKELDKMQKELEEAAKKHRAASAPAATTAKPVAPSP